MDQEEQTKCLAETFQVEKEQRQRSLVGACLAIFEEHHRSHRPLQLTSVFPVQMDELQGSVKQLQAFMDESTQCLQKVSVQLGEYVS